MPGMQQTAISKVMRIKKFGAESLFSRIRAGLYCFEEPWSIKLYLRSSLGWSDYQGVITMEWTAPAFEEVCLNCEINSYASATL
jgi:coenzyme PQQ precursor peptide PqqA